MKICGDGYNEPPEYVPESEDEAEALLASQLALDAYNERIKAPIPTQRPQL